MSCFAGFAFVAGIATGAAVGNIFAEVKTAACFAAGFVIATSGIVRGGWANAVVVLADHAIHAAFIRIAVAIGDALAALAAEIGQAVTIFIGVFYGFWADRAGFFATAIIAVLRYRTSVQFCCSIAFLSI